MKIHFFTAPFYFAFIWFKVQGSRFRVQGSRFKVQGSRGGFAAPKGSQPRLAALGSPFQGKGLAWTLPPSYGRRCPEGAEVGWEKRYEKERERSSQVRRLREHTIHRCAVPLPQWGRLRYESTAIPISSERIHACVEKQYPRHKAFPSRGRWRAK